MTDILTTLAQSIADSVESILSARLEKFIHRFLRSQVKLFWTEAEAAEALGVKPPTLAAWRKAGLIEHTRYPQAKADKLGDIVSYTAADLLNFHNRYAVRVPNNNNVYELNPSVSAFGAEVRRAA